MCLWLPHVPHHNTIEVEKEAQLRPFRPVTVSHKRRPFVCAPYIPHHNTVIIRTAKLMTDAPSNNLHDTRTDALPLETKAYADLPAANMADEKKHLKMMLETGRLADGVQSRAEPSKQMLLDMAGKEGSTKGSHEHISSAALC